MRGVSLLVGAGGHSRSVDCLVDNVCSSKCLERSGQRHFTARRPQTLCSAWNFDVALQEAAVVGMFFTSSLWFRRRYTVSKVVFRAFQTAGGEPVCRIEHGVVCLQAISGNKPELHDEAKRNSIKTLPLYITRAVHIPMI